MNSIFIFKNNLTEYQRLIWIKLAYYTRDFLITKENLQSGINSFNLEWPQELDIESILKALQESNYIVFSDPKKKIKIELTKNIENTIDSFNKSKKLVSNHSNIDNSHKFQSIIVNEFNLSINDIYDQLYTELQKENPSNEIGNISRRLFCFLTSHVIQVGDFFMKNWQAENKIINYTKFCKHKPIANQLDYKYLDRLINYICISNKFKSGKDAVRNFILLYPMLILLRGYCAFSILISFMIDAQSSSFTIGYQKITRFLLEHFQDSSIYLITRPISLCKKSESASNRGAESHTTRLKIYLYDKNRTPTLLRFDLPHKGVPNLHINVKTMSGKTSLNHSKIEEKFSGIDYFFNFIHEQMIIETPHLFTWKDLNKAEDSKILNNMKDFLDYEKQCFKYIEDTVYLDNKKLTDKEKKSIEESLIEKYIDCSSILK